MKSNWIILFLFAGFDIYPANATHSLMADEMDQLIEFNVNQKNSKRRLKGTNNKSITFEEEHTTRFLKGTKKKDHPNVFVASTKKKQQTQKAAKQQKVNKEKVTGVKPRQKNTGQKKVQHEDAKQEQAEQKPSEEEPEQEEPEQEEPEQEEPEQEEPEQEEPKQEEPKQQEPEQQEPEQHEPEQQEAEQATESTELSQTLSPTTAKPTTMAPTPTPSPADTTRTTLPHSEAPTDSESDQETVFPTPVLCGSDSIACGDSTGTPVPSSTATNTQTPAPSPIEETKVNNTLIEEKIIATCLEMMDQNQVNSTIPPNEVDVIINYKYSLETVTDNSDDIETKLKRQIVETLAMHLCPSRRITVLDFGEEMEVPFENDESDFQFQNRHRRRRLELVEMESFTKDTKTGSCIPKFDAEHTCTVYEGETLAIITDVGENSNEEEITQDFMFRLEGFAEYYDLSSIDENIVGMEILSNNGDYNALSVKDVPEGTNGGINVSVRAAVGAAIAAGVILVIYGVLRVRKRRSHDEYY